MFKKARHFFNETKWLLPAIIFLIVTSSYFVHSLQFPGPAFLSDEVSYLTKAATLSGNTVDSASSLHAGYSIFLAPIFLIFDGFNQIWTAIQLFNALFWGGSFVLLFMILKKIFPKKSDKSILLTVLFCSFYPSWIVMSSYSFSTPALVFVFMISLLLLLKSRFEPNKYLVFFGLTTGYLYWIHPSGIVIAAVAVILMIFRALVEKQYKFYLLSTLSILLMIVLYKFGIHPLVNAAMTPDGFNELNHYRFSLRSLARLRHPSVMLKWFIAVGSELSYVLVATFGIAGYAGFELFKRVQGKKTITLANFRKIMRKEDVILITFCVISLFGLFAFGTIGPSLSTRPIRVDHWIYGRYAEVVVLPLLAIGLLSTWKAINTFFLSYYVLFSGALLSLYVTSQNTKLLDNVFVNIASFWPLVFRRDVDYLFWFFIGSLGMTLLFFAVRVLGKWAVVLAIPIFLLTVNIQDNWHGDLLKDYSKPSPVYPFIRANYSNGTCMGFEFLSEKYVPGVIENERQRLHALTLFRFNHHRMSFEDWYKNCDGPFLTSNPDYVDADQDVQYVAREVNSGIYVIVKSRQVAGLDSYLFDKSNDLYVNLSDEQCVIKGCFSKNAFELSQLTEVGVLNDGLIETTNKQGSLFYGPYFRMFAGVYKIQLNAEYDNIGKDSVLQVKSDAGKKIHMVSKLNSKGNYEFNLPAKTEDLEISLFVDDDTRIKLEGYTVHR